MTSLVVKRKDARPKNFYARLLLELYQSAGRNPGVYLNSYRIAGGKSTGNCVGQHSVRRLPVEAALQAAQAAGTQMLTLEIGITKRGSSTVCLEGVVIKGRSSKASKQVTHQYLVSTRDVASALSR